MAWPNFHREMEERSTNRWQHRLKREHPTCTERTNRSLKSADGRVATVASEALPLRGMIIRREPGYGRGANYAQNKPQGAPRVAQSGNGETRVTLPRRGDSRSKVNQIVSSSV